MNHSATQHFAARHREAAAPQVLSHSRLPNFLPVLFFAGALALAPQPAFAQHGGGGGGGGSHSGGGGGGVHSSGGNSGGHNSGGAHAGSGSSSGGVRGGGSGAAAGSAAHSSGGGSYGSGSASSAAGGFNAGTNRWADPPSRGSRVASSGVRTAMPSRMASSAPATHPAFSPAARPAAGHRRFGPLEMFAPDSLQLFGRGRPRQFFFGNGGCFNGLFIGPCGGFGFPFFGFGFGFGNAWFGPWGWDNDGFGAFQNYGYPYEPSMSADIEARVENQPQYYESAPYGYRNDFALPESESAGPAPAADAPFVMLYLKDGTVYALTNYWVAGGKLHYLTQYGGENSVAMDQVDMQRTVDVNAHRGVTITLRPAPEASAAPDSPAPAPPQQ